MRVLVAIATPAGQEVVELEMPEGSTVEDAIRAAKVALPGGAPEGRAGIWSRAVSLATPLREGDRVEVYRELKADPKDARRARARLKPSTRSRSGP
ncbi:MAG: RnfH family protein [Usitatibacter sp.]